MDDRDRIPIGVFAYNRPENLRLALESLGRCDGYEEFDLHVFCDAPRTEKDAPGVEAARAQLTAVHDCLTGHATSVFCLGWNYSGGQDAR